MLSAPIVFLILPVLGLTIDAGLQPYPRSNVELFDRATTPCSPGGTPVLYKNYTNEECGPPENLAIIGSDGHLQCPVNFKNRCGSYCQVYQAFQYDVEVPVTANPYCHGPLTCTVTESDTTTWTYDGKINAGLGSEKAKTMSAGVTGGISFASAKMQLTSKSVKLEQGECGYMTFLPELHISW